MKKFFVVYLFEGCVVHTIIEASKRSDAIELVKDETPEIKIQSVTVIETK